MATFGTLSDRLTETFKNLRTKGKLSASDVDGTVREIRRALLDADVSLDVVKQFTATVRERALSDEVNQALNPAQQVVQIVNEELIGILGGQQRRLEFAKNPPTVRNWCQITVGAVIITGTMISVSAVDTKRPETRAALKWTNHDPASPPTVTSRRMKSNSTLSAIGITPSAVTVAVSSTGRTRWAAVISIALTGST